MEKSSRSSTKQIVKIPYTLITTNTNMGNIGICTNTNINEPKKCLKFTSQHISS